MPKNAERLFGSLHFVPRPGAGEAVLLGDADRRVRNRRERVEPLHRAAGRVVRDVLADVERHLPGRHVHRDDPGPRTESASEVTLTTVPTLPFESSVAIATSAIR